MSDEIRVTQSGALAETEGDDSIHVTHTGVHAEIEGDDSIHVTHAGAFTEIEKNPELHVTQLGILVEIEFVPPPLNMPTYWKTPGGTRRIHRALPDEVTGYSFDPRWSWWSSVVPEVTENLVRNPSFEKAVEVGEFHNEGCSFLRETTANVGATHGRYVAALETTLGAAGTAYLGYGHHPGATYDPLLRVDPGNYTASMDLYVDKRTQFAVSIREATGTAVSFSTLTVVSRYGFVIEHSGWQRIEFPYAEIASGNRTVVLEIIQPDADNIKVWTDAWQFENKSYATTYADGDMFGMFDRNPNDSYFWKGEPHHSVSVRRANVGAGGRIVSWSDEFNFQTTGIVGLGMSPVEVVSQSLSRGQELFRDTNFLPREFTITGRLFGNNYPELSKARNEFIKLVRPNNTAGRKPQLLRYHPLNENGAPYGAPMEIACTYIGGLQGNITNLYQETIGAQFRALDPSLQETIDSYSDLTPYKQPTNNGFIYRTYEGDYVNLNTGATSGNYVALVDFVEGHIPIVVLAMTDVTVGTITVAGDTTENTVAYWDDLNDVWLAANATDAIEGTPWMIDAIPFAQPGGGSFCIVGNFVLRNPSDGVTQAGRANAVVGNLDTDSFDANVSGVDGLATDVTHTDTGDFYICGAFDQDDSANNLYKVARYTVDSNGNYSGPMRLNFGSDTTLSAIETDGRQYVYVGGIYGMSLFNDTPPAGEVVSNGVGRWNLQTTEWEAMTPGLGGTVFDLQIMPDQSLMAVGTFNGNHPSETGSSMKGVARWNGNIWESVFDFSEYVTDYTTELQYCQMALDPVTGILWFYSKDESLLSFVDIPGIGSTYMFGWKDGIFYPSFRVMDTDSANRGISDLKFREDGSAMFSHRDNYTGTLYVPHLNRVEYVGTADAKPKIHMNGRVAEHFIANLSTQATLYFSSELDLVENEEAILVLTKGNSRFHSNFRPNLINFILAGSSDLRDFRLIPGENRISTFMPPASLTASDLDLYMLWCNAYWSIDASTEM